MNHYRLAAGGREWGQRRSACVLCKLVIMGESRIMEEMNLKEKFWSNLKSFLNILSYYQRRILPAAFWYSPVFSCSLWNLFIKSSGTACRRWSFATANHQVLLPKMVGFCCFSYSLEQHFYEDKIAPKFGCLQTFFFALFLVEGQWMNVFIGVISASLWIQMRYTDTRGTW